MVEPDLLYLSAQQAAGMIRRRKLSPVELTEAVLAQIERIAPLNAFVTVLYDQARTAARAAERAVMRAEALAPLHGVPVHVKDQVDTAGIRTSFGSAIFADNVPDRDDLQALFTRYDVLITPTLTRTALAADFDAANDEVIVNGVKCGITRLGWTAYVYPFNLTGHPALTVPSGFAADGLPTAVQIVGRWGADMDVLRLGALLEEARPWSGKRPVLPG